MLHIVFREEDVNTLTEFFKLDESERGEVFHISDNYALGPLKNIYTSEGLESRKNWWLEVLSGGDFDNPGSNGVHDDSQTIQEIKSRLQNNDEAKVCVWVAPNNHDVCGYYWLISQLMDSEDKVQIIWLNNLPFLNEKGHIFYPDYLFEIPPKEFLKARKLTRPVSAAEFEIDPEEWTKICEPNKIIRTLDGHKKLSQHDEDFYDLQIQKFITADWQKASKVIQLFINKSDKTASDSYVLWRLKKMVAADAIDAQGELKNMKDFEVKVKPLTQ